MSALNSTQMNGTRYYHEQLNVNFGKDQLRYLGKWQ